MACVCGISRQAVHDRLKQCSVTSLLSAGFLFTAAECTVCVTDCYSRGGVGRAAGPALAECTLFLSVDGL